MSFMESVKTCFSKYATFSGRATRSEYWWFVLFVVVVAAILGFVGGMIGLGSLLGSIFQLATIVPLFAAGARRMHDTDRSGWFILVPIMNIVWAIQKGTEGENRFG